MQNALFRTERRRTVLEYAKTVAELTSWRVAQRGQEHQRRTAGDDDAGVRCPQEHAQGTLELEVLWRRAT